MVTSRTVESIARTILYGGVAIFLFILDAQKIEIVDAVVLGAILGDYMTWLIRSLMLLPSNIMHGCYDMVLNTAFGIFLLHFCKFKQMENPESNAVVFLTFVFVLGIKVTYYTFHGVISEFDDE